MRENSKEKKLYSVEIVETLHRVVTVAASDLTEAHRSVSDCWKKGDIVLTAEDFEGVEFKAKAAQDGEWKKGDDGLCMKRYRSLGWKKKTGSHYGRAASAALMPEQSVG